MTYLTKFTDNQMLVLRPTLDQLRNLAPGSHIIAKFGTPAMAEKVRHWLYSWLHLNNRKELFIVRKFRPAELMIQAVEQVQAPTIEVPTLRAAEEFVLECLLDVTEESEATACIISSELSPEDQIHALAEWKRINS